MEVCPAWALDWRWESFAGRVGSNRESEATAWDREMPVCSREAVWGRSPRRTAAPNGSEPLSRLFRPGERAFECDARNPTEAVAIVGTGAAGHPVHLTRGGLHGLDDCAGHDVGRNLGKDDAELA